MRTTLLVGLLFVGCGVTEAELTDVGADTTEELGELGTSTRSYVVFRRDTRRCIAPLCGGFWVHDVNRATLNEQYVSGFDFSTSNLRGLPEHQADVTNGGNFEVVLYGKLGPKESNYNTRTFLVSDAWRGMPGVTFTEPADSFMRVQSVNLQCFAAPCPTLRATKLHSTSKTLFHDLEVKPAALPMVDRNWLANRVIENDALVAGRFVAGNTVGTGQEKVLETSQIFVHLPDRTQSCPRSIPPSCTGGKTGIWSRNHNLCSVPAGCTLPGACAAFVPSCADGYELVSWTGGPFACTQYACDPAFLND
jgi:hypothetical protein